MHTHADIAQNAKACAQPPLTTGALGAVEELPIETSPAPHAPRALLRLRQRVVRILDLLETLVRLLDAVLVLVCTPRTPEGFKPSPTAAGCVGSGAVHDHRATSTANIDPPLQRCVVSARRGFVGSPAAIEPRPRLTWVPLQRLPAVRLADLILLDVLRHAQHLIVTSKRHARNLLEVVCEKLERSWDTTL